MSWQPDIPTGFSPCGVAFGALRKPYSVAANFFADDVNFPNRIKYYIVPDDTLIYDKPHVFFPRIDQPEWNKTSPFEKCGPSRGLRTYYAGDDVYGFSKDHVDGDEDDFLGRSLSTKYSVDGNPPENPCVGSPRFKDGLQLAFYSSTLACTCDTIGTFYPFIRLSLTCPGDPRFDGIFFDVPFVEDFLILRWYLEIEFLGETWFVQIAGPHESTFSCSLGVNMSNITGGHVTSVFVPFMPYSHCDPLTWTGDGEIFDPGATGNIVSFSMGSP